MSERVQIFAQVISVGFHKFISVQQNQSIHVGMCYDMLSQTKLFLWNYLLSIDFRPPLHCVGSSFATHLLPLVNSTSDSGIASYSWVPQTLYYCKSSTTPVNSTSLKWIYFCKMLEITLVTVFPDWHWKNYPLSGVHWLCLAWRLSILSLFLPSPSPPAHLGPQNIALVAWNLALVWMLERLGKKAAFCFSSMRVKDWNDAGGETVLSQEGVLVKRSQDIWKRQIQ